MYEKLGKRFVLAAVALAAAMSAAPAVAATRAATTSSTSTTPVRFGVVDGRLLGASPAQQSAALDDDAAAGVTTVREQLSWNAVEGVKGVFNWAPFDQLVNQVASHHMSLLVLIDFTPSWARPSACTTWYCAPADPRQFASFAGLAAARYGSHVAAWEVWNEPNSMGFWAPKPNAAAYSTLLNDTAAAIRANSPGAFVVSAGLAPEPDAAGNIDPVAFLSGVCSAGGLSSVNAVGDHPYSSPVPPDYPAAWNAWQQMNNTSPSLRSVMAGCGAGSKPIWITEYGAPTDGPGAVSDVGNYNLAAHPDHVTEALQAQMVDNAVTDVASYPWVGALFFYSSQDAGTSTSTVQNFYGLRRYDGSAKPAWTTLQSDLAKLP